MLNRIFPIYFFLCKLLNMNKNMQKYTKTILNLKSIKVKTHLFRTYRVLLKRHLCGITSTERGGQRENKMRKLLLQWHWQHDRYKVPNLNYKIIWTFKIAKHAIRSVQREQTTILRCLSSLFFPLRVDGWK